MIAARNKAARQRQDALLQSYLGDGADMSKYSPEQREAIEKLATEKQVAYARIAKRDRMNAYRKQYDIDNPDDPAVKARAAAKKRGEKEEDSQAIGATVRMIAKVVTTLVAIGTSIVAGVSKLIDAVVDLRTAIRGGNMKAMLSNLTQEQVMAWDLLAQSKKISPDLLYSATGDLMSKFGDATLIAKSSSAIGSVAPLLKDRVQELLDMGLGSSQNQLPALDMIAQTLLESSRAGVTAAGTNVPPSQALGANLANLSASGFSTEAELIQPYMYDVMGGKFEGSLQDWLFQKAPGGKNPDESLTTQNGTSRGATEGAGDAWTDTLASIKGTLGNILSFFSGDLKQFAYDARAFFADVLAHLGVKGPQAQLTIENIAFNKKARELAEALLPGETDAAKTALARLGVSGYDLSKPGSAQNFIDIATGAKPGYIKGLTDAVSAQFIASKDARDALAMLADTQEAMAKLSEQDDNVRNRKTVARVAFDPYQHGASSMYAAMLIAGVRSKWSTIDLYIPGVPGEPLTAVPGVDAGISEMGVEGYIKKLAAGTYVPSARGTSASVDPKYSSLIKNLYYDAAFGPQGDPTRVNMRLGRIQEYLESLHLPGAMVDAEMKRVRAQLDEVERFASINRGDSETVGPLQDDIMRLGDATTLKGQIAEGLLNADGTLPGLSEALASSGTTITVTPQGTVGSQTSSLTVTYIINDEGKIKKGTFTIPNGTGLDHSVTLKSGSDAMSVLQSGYGAQPTAGK